MSNTYLIDEVRATRRRIAAECGNDLAEITRRAEETAERLGFKAVKAA